MATDHIPIGKALGDILPLARKLAVWFYLAFLAWAPFPLGGAIPWASGLQTMLLAVCCLFWIAGNPGTGELSWTSNRIIAGPLFLALAVLTWGLTQILPVIPQTWSHPVWSEAAAVLGVPANAYISIDPWRTETEIIKLASYVVATWLAFRMARTTKIAELLLNGIIVIGACYATYAFVLDASGSQQAAIFYSIYPPKTFLSGPFMLHNSFATYCGLAAIASVAKLFALGTETVGSGRTAWRLAGAAIQFCCSRGAPYLIAATVTFAGVVASASRAGFVSCVCGLVVLILLSLIFSKYRGSIDAKLGGYAAAALLFAALVSSGGSLSRRAGELFASDLGDPIRMSLWTAARHMIASSPWLGLGLGTFEQAYPMYAAQVFPLVMDKAHCDYLEFAAGIGLPAAVVWLVAMGWLMALCLIGLSVRRRNRHFCAVAISATALIALHSCVDFSLQMPAVALLYACLLGLGVAQSQSSKQRANATD